MFAVCDPNRSVTGDACMNGDEAFFNRFLAE